MFRRPLLLALALSAGLIASGTARAACTRATLQGVVDRYLASQAMGDPQSLPMVENAPYVEQGHPADVRRGILAQPMKIASSHSLLDVRQCQTFSELAVIDPSHPYVISTRLSVSEDVITAVRTLVTGAADGPLDAEGWVRALDAEDWGVLPREQRVDRTTLVAAANAYLDYFSDRSLTVPWGNPCRRLEGGQLSGSGASDDRCDAGLPQGVKIVDRSFVVDEQLGAVAVLANAGGRALPATQLLRLVEGRIRLVHAVSPCWALSCEASVPAAANPR
jgi:hypothetical protein